MGGVSVRVYVWGEKGVWFVGRRWRGRGEQIVEIVMVERNAKFLLLRLRHVLHAS
jgi:hypothetical protein